MNVLKLAPAILLLVAGSGGAIRAQSDSSFKSIS